MKNILNTVFVIILTFVLFSGVYAIDAPTGIELVSSSENSLEVKWKEAPGALGYYFKYATSSGAEFIGDELTETNSFEINLLKGGTDYYVAVVSIDENGEESKLSEKVMFTTKGGGPVIEEFQLTGVEAISFNKLKLKFNADLEDGTDVVREFKIVNKKDEFNQLEIINNELNKDEKDEVIKNELILTLDNDMVAKEEYILTVVAIKDKSNRNIELGVNSVENFVVPEVFEIKVLDSGVGELESAGLEDEPVLVDEVKEEEGNKVDLTDVKDSAKKLPNTGPEHILILLLALIFGFLIVMFKNKKA